MAITRFSELPQGNIAVAGSSIVGLEGSNVNARFAVADLLGNVYATVDYVDQQILFVTDYVDNLFANLDSNVSIIQDEVANITVEVEEINVEIDALNNQVTSLYLNDLLNVEATPTGRNTPTRGTPLVYDPTVATWVAGEINPESGGRGYTGSAGFTGSQGYTGFDGSKTRF